MKFRDQMGNTIVLPEYPKRIISLVPSLTELLFDLGLDREIIGITDYCVLPKDKVKNRVKIGGPKHFDFPVIDALKPDLLIGNMEENYRAGILRLQEKYPVWMSDITTLTDMLEAINGIGAITGCEEKAKWINREISDRMNRLPRFKPLKAAYLIWKDPLMAAGGSTFINGMMEMCGFVNIFSAHNRYPVIEKGDLASAEIILLSSEPYPFSASDRERFLQEFPQIDVEIVDAMMFSWYGSHILYSADYFAKLRKIIDKKRGI